MSAAETTLSRNSKQLVRRNRWILVGALIGLLALGGVFAAMTEQALYVRSKTGSVFNTYVIQHGIGHAEVADDVSGFQGDFCVLHLNKPLPQARLQSRALQLMQQYYNLDGGTTLSIRYQNPATGKEVDQADVVYSDGSGDVSLILNVGQVRKTVHVKVDWPNVNQAG